MVTYRDLTSADLGPLDEAVVKWRNLPSQFNTISREFDGNVAARLRGSDWTGETADAAFVRLDDVTAQFHAAEDEAGAIHRLLESALEAFRSAQKRARAVRDEVEEDRNLSISAQGVVSFSATADDDDGSRQRLYAETISGYNTRVRAAVGDATDADEALHWALTQDRNGRDQGFNAGTYDSVQVAAEGRRQAVRDAEAVTRILAEGASASHADLQQLNRTLSRREGDPFFAEQVALKAGPRGVLEFWSGVTADQDRSKAEEKILTRLQESLGHTLATATHSQSPEMREWKKDIIDLGSDRVFGAVNSSADPQKSRPPYGFQLLSSLMHEGDYDSDFLQTYGRELIDFEKKNSEHVWTDSVDPYELHIGGLDKGNDPFSGFLTALGNNPEASKGFFSSDEGKLDKELQYLLLDRDWPHDPVEGEDPRRGYAYDELGRALESATLGVPYREVGLQRDDVTANVMEQVVAVVAERHDLLDKMPGLTNSLAEMGAGYIDDLTWATALMGGSMEPPMRADLFDRSSAGHAEFSSTDARWFLYNVGQQAGGHEVLSASQHAYTASLMEAHGDEVSMARHAQNVGAYNHGVLDEARTSQIDQDFRGKAEAANKAREDSSSWQKYSVSTAVGGIAALGVTAAAGPGAGIATAVAVPIVVDAGVKAFDTYFGNEMNENLKAMEKDFSAEAGLASEEFVERGRAMAISNGHAYQKIHQVDNPGEMSTEANSAYSNGKLDADSMDAD
ncbi:hypothetical protein IF129_15655 [Streptomyces chumphonensis]|uniref:Uncharacterized protein n=1 Tax=Streptomyces chumphonensis TaxID=1214925 RepID=A0A927F0I8_9ACTN|nr:hypothetical protein [Streptomyces chumphonensis]MBD3932981.1 hypothetical protein [Streptomyces chumphonensis]